ncbi:unnamed protein product [Coregonus sp. 'balchen']|nr:unnamed protein product [Coregonus sp. 'balchen']
MLLFSFVLFSACLGNSFGDSINPVNTEELVQEGRNVHLSCKYDGTVYNLQWYRQYPRSKPEFLFCEDLTPLKKEEYCLEGTHVTLSYNYSRTASAGDEFYWYHQDTAQRPEFLLYISGTGFIKKADPLNTRISTKLNEEKNRLDLEISSAEVTDSALYYCAVRPTVTGNLHTLYKNLSRDHICRNIPLLFRHQNTNKCCECLL